MNLLQLLNLEYRKIRNDLKHSLEKKRFLASYVLILVSLIFLHQGLHLLLFQVIGIQEKIRALELWNIKPLNTILPIWMIYSVLRGLISSDFVNQFDATDIQLLFSMPFSRRDIYLSKYFLGFSKRLITFALLFTSINPIFSFLKIMKLDLRILFLTVFIFLELNSLLSNISFLVFRCLLNPYLEKRRIKKQAWISLSLVFIGLLAATFFLTPGDIGLPTKIVNPTYLVTNIVSALLGGSENTNSIIAKVGILTLVYAAFLTVSYLLSYNFDLHVVESIKNAEEESHSLLTNLVNWNGIQRVVDFPPFLLKDIISFTREHGSSMILELIINYGVFVLFIPANIFPTIIPLDGYTNLYLISPPMVAILILNLVSPSTELLINEVETMWLVKTSGTSMNALFISKYVLSVVKSFLFLMPLILMVYLESPLNNLIIIFLVINVIFIYNALRLLIPSFFLVDSRNFLTGTFSMHFIQIVISFVITGLYVSLLFFHPGIVLLIFNIVIALSITEYYVSNSFVVFDFLTKFYLVGLISFYTTGLVFVFVASRATFLNITMSSLFNTGLFLVISSVVTYNVLRVSSRLTVRNLVDYDDF